MKPTTGSTADPAIAGEGQTGDQEFHRNSNRRLDSRSMPKETSPTMAESESDPAWTLEVAARDYIWLYDLRHGVGPREIAARGKVSVRQVREGLERARMLERNRLRATPVEMLKSGSMDDLGLRLTPLFPIGSFTPQSACPHHSTIKSGSKLCCMVCHASGMDDHPGLRRDSQTDPSPEPQPNPEPAVDLAAASKSNESAETRKQRRRRQFAEAAAVA
jgi:hypothetical protein